MNAEYRLIVAALAAALGLGALAAAHADEPPRGATGTRQSTYLCTAPDPTAGGGLHGRLVAPAKPVVKILAQATDEWKRVYAGALLGDGREFRFTGLPVGQYDLLVLYGDEVIEGLTLSRQDSTLTGKDRDAIAAALMKSNPFFNEKRIHRCEGVTGMAGKARCVLQEVRTRPVTLQSAEVRSDIQIRSFKLALLEDVAIGWSVIETREFARQEVAATDTWGLLAHRFSPKLGGIRVIDTVKELGDISLP